ncbi:type IV secretory system conjugative DNA transfer VirD4/TraG family protein [Aquamicrobium defluvii]|uniref:Type IV secretory system conjugative DNA transfer VirD4/TraG family protein n=1 Tax=Aquamicrobium defluvii TaxID=69279 RepID=A0A4R6Y9E7_9HYPH|nr:type IV secretory system conjugative DNA transfer VirD4/TraG family protein [Aquamicrobium defluvii]
MDLAGQLVEDILRLWDVEPDQRVEHRMTNRQAVSAATGGEDDVARPPPRIAASGGFLSIAVAITLSVMRAREASDIDTYSSARWAERPEIENASLLGEDGVVLGRYSQDYLRHDGPEHILCFAPTRSGKGLGLVVPSLLTWPGSAIVHDIKGENW